MSASSSSSSTTRAIPFSKDPRNDHINFSQSLGGTIYGTTPGGTKLVYDRNTLLQYRNSPLAKTPPPEMATIMEIINTKQSPKSKSNLQVNGHNHQTNKTTPTLAATTPTPASSTETKTPASTAKTNEEDIFMME